MLLTFAVTLILSLTQAALQVTLIADPAVTNTVGSLFLMLNSD
jgi:hypothetical protein